MMFIEMQFTYCNMYLLQADDYLSSLSIKALPGIGHTVSTKLKSKEIGCCGQLRNISKVCWYYLFSLCRKDRIGLIDGLY